MTLPKIVSTEPLFSGPAFDIHRETVEFDENRRFERDILKHPGAVVIVPMIADQRFIMLRQYRHALREFILEFPAGTLEPNEDPLVCAKRELIEETGYAASEWKDLGTLYPAPGFCNEIQYCYLASNLSPAHANKDEDEIIESLELSRDEIEAYIKNNQLRDAKSIALLLRLDIYQGAR